MNWRAIVLFAVAMATTVVSAQSNTTESQSIFGDLPEGNYSTGIVSTIDTGSLQGLFNMATGFVDVVFKPFSELADLAEVIFNSENAGQWFLENWGQVVAFDAGYVACLVFGLLFFILVPLVGSFMCCCRACCGNCGGRLEQSPKRSKSCWRQCLCVTMLILTVLMAIPTVFVFLTNEWITDVIDFGPNKIVTVLDDTSEYLNVVPKQINYVTDQYNTVDANVRPLVENLGTSVGIPFQTFVSDAAVDSLAALDQAAKVQQDAIDAIAVVNTSLAELETGMVTLNLSLSALQGNMTTNLGVPDCTNDTSCNATLVSAGVLEVGFNVLLIVPLRDDLVSVNEDLGGYNISELGDNVQKEIDDIPQTVASNTSDASKKAVDALDEASKAVEKVSENLPTDSLESIDETITNIQKQTTDAVTTYNDDYEYYRYIAGIVLGSILAFIVGCYLLGLLLGACGNDRKISPPERGTASNCGGIWLMVGVGFSFIFSWILMLLVVVLFTVGGHGERYGCQGLDEPKYEALGLVEDFTEINLTSTFNLPPDAQLTLASLLNSCKEDKSVYSALQLEYIYNVTAYLGDVSQQMTTLEEELDSSVDAVDLDSLVIYTEADQTDVLALTETNLNTINFTNYLEDLGTGVTKTDLTAYAMFLRTSADNFTGAAEKFQDLVYDYADDVDRIQTNEVADMQDDYNNLETSINDLVNIAGSLNTTIDQLDVSLTSLNNTIQSESRDEIQKIADDLYSQVEGNVTAYTNWAGVQVTDKVGACRPVYDAYIVSVGIVCDYVIDTTNGLWFSLGWCLFFLLPAAIVAMKLMKFFRRMTYEEAYEEETSIPQLIYLPGLKRYHADNIRSWGDMEMRDYPASGNKANGGYY